MQQHIVIEGVSPTVDGGLYPIKRVVGDCLHVQADIFRDGHEKIAAQLRLGNQAQSSPQWTVEALHHVDNDRWEARVMLPAAASMIFCIDAWTDTFATWLVDLGKRVEAGFAVHSEVEEGVRLVHQALAAAQGEEHAYLQHVAEELRRAADNPSASYALASQTQLSHAMHRLLPRDDLVSSLSYPVTVDRPRALYGTWYELFVRSCGDVPHVGATFETAQRRLPHLQDLGFDVVYLAPIYPIGVTKRKGPNNALKAGLHDPGCPWAIGSASGGHDAIEPALGGLQDFDAFVAAARRHDIEIALDFAVQCSPDHPWVGAHPHWFNQRPDGTIKCAENPPKKYEDVYPINFDTSDKDGLYQALLDVLLFWIDHGVKIFRVDNPHTKPFAFWQWAIVEVRRRHADVIFLAEAFTRPKVMKLLAKVGFTQSYTYFTWRNTAAELRTYIQELTQSGSQHYLRPNFFINTPDILPAVLQHGGPAAFKMRLVTAATLSPTYGIYSGYELCENAALPQSEEYLDSEKYEVRVRNYHAPGNINDLIKRINHIRATNVALRELCNIDFFVVDNPHILAFGKRSGDNTLIVAINMDPYNPHHGSIAVPADFVGIAPAGRYDVMDLLDGAIYNWGEHNYVRLTPNTQCAHILRLQHRH